MTDPSNPRIIGGYDPSNPATAIAANETNSSGNFSVQINPAAFATNGIKTIGIYATDVSGTTGNIATPRYHAPDADQQPEHHPPTKPTVVTLAAERLLGEGSGSPTSPRRRLSGQPHRASPSRPSSRWNNNPVPGQPLATATADSNGNYVLQFPNPLPNGPVTIQVVAGTVTR